MAKTKISEFNANPALNTDIDSINIAEGCAPSGINDAIRELMAQLKDFQTGAVGDSFNGPIGTSTAAAGAFTTLSATGAITSTLATGTAPLVIASTTKVANLNVDLLDGADWASPAALGSTTPAAGSFTTLGASSTATLNTLASSGATLTGGTINGMTIGATTASTGAFTTLAASSSVTLSGGTANGVAYLNGSKVVTSGSALVFDGSNLGLSVTPSAWQTLKAFEFGTGSSNGSLYSYAGDLGLGANVYYSNATGLSYINTAVATQYRQVSGQHRWLIAASGTAGTTISFTQAMTLNASGNLGIGTTSPTQKLEVQVNDATVYTTTSSSLSGPATVTLIQNANTTTGVPTLQTFYATRGGNLWYQGIVDTSTTNYAGSFAIGNRTGSTAYAERLRIDSSGNVGIGTSSPSTKLHVAGGNIYLDTGYNYTAATGGGYWASGSATPYVTGWYESSGSMLFRTSSSTRATLDSSGNLGIGTTSPAVKLDVVGGQAYISAPSSQYALGLRYNSTTNGTLLGSPAASTFTISTWGGTEQLRLDSSGNLGIGTSSPSQKVEVTSSGTSAVIITSTGGTAQLMLNPSGTNPAYINYNRTSASVLAFYDNFAAAERMRLDASGNLLVGKTSAALGTAGVEIQPVGYVAITRSDRSFVLNRLSTDGAVAEFYKNGTSVGTISVTGSATAYNTSSDQRLKENIQDADSASSLIDSLQVRKFDWKADGSHQRYGFVAQELATVAPEAVHQPEDTEEMMAVDYSKLVPMLVKEIQSLRKRLADAGL